LEEKQTNKIPQDTQSPKDEEGTDNLTLKGRGKEHEKSVILFFFIKC
jgi:hypothetical protein